LLSPGASLAQEAEFDRSIKPLLEANCSQCHSDSTKNSGFSVATLESVIAGGNRNGRAVIPGKPADSPLIKALRGSITPKMPLGKSLPDGDIARIEKWIQGMKPAAASATQQWLWSFRKPAPPTIPSVKNARWVRNPIDAFILSKLEEKSIAPAAAASKRVLARRVWFDLLGLPPTPEETEAFVRDESSRAYERLIDRLLEDSRYGERWGRHWLDLVRYAETDGLEGDVELGRASILNRITPGNGNAWRYRDWVIDAFNVDMPYDEFVRSQIGGADEHSKTRGNYHPDIQSYIPLGYFRVAPWDVGNLVADEVRQSFLDEITGTTASVYLGMTLGCARCHDHKYDPIPTKDYYRFQAFFNAIQVRDLEVPFANKQFRELAERKADELRKRLDSGPEKRALDEYEKQMLATLKAKKVAEAKTGELGREDLRLELRKRKQTVFSELETNRHERLKVNADRTQDPDQEKALDSFEEELLVKLKDAYKRGVVDPLARFDELTPADVRRDFGNIYDMARYFNRDEIERHRDLSMAVEILERQLSRWQPVALTVTNVPGPPVGPGLPSVHVLTRGDFRQPADAVQAGFPSVITGNSEPALIDTDRYRQFPTRGYRMTLAKWIASAENPLTARVMVNRIWQQHFGRGIVATTSDFGKNGSRPTHPELLDWLALEFVKNGWSIKSMHRLMLTSNTYRQAADNPAANDNISDPDNTLFWRFNRRRLEAEVIRDSVLLLSGRLSPERGGPPVFPPLPKDMADLAKPVPIGGVQWESNQKDDEDGHRRSIYIFQRRSLPLPMLASFDAPVFQESCERRSVTTTSLQSLSLMNGDLLNEEADHLAARIIKETGADRAAQVRRAFEVVLNRTPGDTELRRTMAFRGSLAAICRVLLSSNEMLYVE
jgi:hypothetical protein